VDAICINQNDDQEKSEQVWNMLLIFQKASRVIAWLGAAQEDVGNVLIMASSIAPHLSTDKIYDFWSIHRGLSYLYTRSWFKRIWVQQEIFAARKLRLQCGNLRFKWSEMLCEPKMLSNIWHIDDKAKDKKKLEGETVNDIGAQVNAITSLDHLHTPRLNCFEQFSMQSNHRQDFVETLLDTGVLNASNPRDYTYGIMGMTAFPARAMLLDE
jgi:heterokaryon incompatibility protein (HET)